MIYLQTPAFAIYGGTTDPAVFGVDTTIVFNVSVQNTGEAAIQLDSAQTILRLLTSPPYAPINLAGISPQRINGGQTVTLEFRQTFIGGVAPGDYGVQLTLIGTSTGKSFTQTILAGQVNIGGEVYWGPAAVSPNQMLQGHPGVRGYFNRWQ